MRRVPSVLWMQKEFPSLSTQKHTEKKQWIHRNLVFLLSISYYLRCIDIAGVTWRASWIPYELGQSHDFVSRKYSGLESTVGWVEFLQILVKHSVSRALYFLSSEWCILLYRNRLWTKLPQGLYKLGQNWAFWRSRWRNFEKTQAKQFETKNYHSVEPNGYLLSLPGSGEMSKNSFFRQKINCFVAGLCAIDFNNMHHS